MENFLNYIKDNNDIINACWEFMGGISVFSSIKTLYLDKMVKGYNWKTIFFFTSWGIWNVYFYPVNNHMYSFYGGLFLCSMNITWVIFILYYKFKK